MRNRYRPRLELPRQPVELLLDWLSLLGVGVGIALTIWGWLTLPATIPTHFDFAGNPNAYGSKATLLLLPIISTCVAALLALLTRFPHMYNYPWPITLENASRQYLLARKFLRIVMLEIVWMFAGLQWLIIQAAQNQSESRILLFVAAMVFILLLSVVLFLRAAFRAR